MECELAALRLRLIEETENFLNKAFGFQSTPNPHGADPPREPSERMFKLRRKGELDRRGLNVSET